MTTPFGFLLFGLVFFLIMAVGNVMQAHRKNEKTYYLGATVSLIMALASFFILINQILPVIVLMASAFLLSVVGWPKMSRVLSQEWTKLLQESDISVPLRGRDLLTMKGWLKLTSRWGVRRTVFLYSLLILTILGMTLFTLSLWSGMSILYVATYTITTTIGSAVMFYKQINKVLTTTSRREL